MTAVEELILQRYGNLPKDLRINEEGHSARGNAECNCSSVAKITACSDVGMIMLYCPKCGDQDL